MTHTFRSGPGRRLLPVVLALAVCPLACKRHQAVAERPTIEEGPAPSVASTVHMGDPRAASQLIAGFHDIENGSWRWTMKQFSLSLHPPSGSAQRGAVLTLSLSVPPVVIEKLHAISLTASIGETAFPAETWTKPGDYAYKREVPAAVLSGDAVRVDFQLDKAMPPSDKDLRELGIVVTKASLELK